MKNLLSLNIGLSFAFSLVVILTAICISGFLCHRIRTEMASELRKRMHDIVAIGVSKIDGDLHAQLTRPEQEDSDLYRKLKKTLQEVRDGGSGIRYVYTLRYVSSQNYRFVVDAEESKENISHLGDEFKANNIDAAFDVGNRIYIRDTYDVDQWGTWLSGFAQIRTANGNVDAVMGIDISAASIVKQERETLIQIVIIVSVITLLVLLVGIVIARRISTPLAILEKDMIRIKDFILDDDLKVRSRFKEIVNIKRAEDNMKIGLRSFKKYVPADLVSQLIRMNKEARLGGEKRELSIFFSDIAGFTSISEKLSPEQMSQYMAQYFKAVTSVILKHHGTVDKYIGDAVMAFWGAPVALSDHAFLAIQAALDCQRVLSEMNENFAKTGEPQFHTRVGINTGEVIVGNFGYEDRFNYTVLGDAVNTASRLEGINKVYQTNIIISDQTYQLVKDRIAARKIDIVAVKGKATGIPIYEVCGLAGTLPEAQSTFIRLFNEGMESYLRMNWSDAIALMGKALLINPGDAPSRIIVERCEKYMADPPSDGWQGIVVMREK